MKVIKEIQTIFQNIQKHIKDGKYEKLNSVFDQSKYAKLFQNIYQLHGDQVKTAVDDLMKEIIIQTKEQFKNMLKNDSNDESLLKIFNQILKDQMIQIYWISVIFNQFNEFVFKGFQQLSIQQYCLKQILENSFGKYSKKVVQAIMDALWIRKKQQDFNKRFDQDLLKIINFFSYRTFLNHLTIEKSSKDFQMDVIFNCDFTEEEAVKLIRIQELQKQEDQIILLSSDEDEKILQSSDEDDEKEDKQDNNQEKGEAKVKKKAKIMEKSKVISKGKNKGKNKKPKGKQNKKKYESEDEEEVDIIEEEIKNQDSKESSMEIEMNKDMKEKNKKNLNNNKVLESLYSLIEDMYMERLISDSQELIAKIKNNKVSEQIDEIEEFIFREQQFVSFYLNRLSIKISDKLFNLCVLQNYPNLVNNSQYGLSYLFEQKNIDHLQSLYSFVQNDQNSIQTLGTSFTQIIESKIQSIEKEQEKLFSQYSQSKKKDNNQMVNRDDDDSQLSKDIQFIEECQDKWIQQMYALYQEMHNDGLDKSFDNNPALNAALSRGFEHQFHLSEVAVEYLANTCHLLLLKPEYRKCDKNSHENPEKELIIIKKLFSFISSKDLFLEIYRNKLSRRLIYSLSISQQTEELFLNTLESVVGLNQPIKQMKAMIGDLKKNQLLQFDYQSNSQTEKKQDEKFNNQKEKDNQEIDSKPKKQNSNSRKSQSRSRSRSNSRERRRTRRENKRSRQIDDFNDDNDNSVVRKQLIQTKNQYLFENSNFIYHLLIIKQFFLIYKNIFVQWQKNIPKMNLFLNKFILILIILFSKKFFSQIMISPKLEQFQLGFLQYQLFLIIKNKKEILSDNNLEEIRIDQSQSQEITQENKDSGHDLIKIDDDDAQEIIIDDDNNNNQKIKKIKRKSKKTQNDQEIIDLESQMVNEEEEKLDNQYEENNNQIELDNDAVNIRILTNYKWPLKQQKVSEQAILPAYLKICYQEYSDKYLKEFQQRKLELLHHCSYSSLKFRSDYKKQFNGQYTLKVSSYSMIILLRFNIQNKFSFNQLQEQTQLKNQLLIEKLKLLVKTDLLTIQKNSSMEIENESEQNIYNNAVYILNTKFTNTNQQIDLDWLPNDEVYSNKMLSALKNNQSSLNTKSEYSSQIADERIGTLQANIAKIMKDKKSLQQDELIKQVQQKLKNINELFVPSSNSVKEQIKKLTQYPHEFLKYSDNQEEKDLVIYVS